MTKRVVLHVGCPKTGTSAIQHLLATNADLLADRGFLYPPSVDGFEQHFAATKDLHGAPVEGDGPLGPGAWDRLAAEVRAWPGTAIISHELLASCTPEQVKRAVDSVGGVGVVRVVITARDLARQIPSAWQENVKHGFPGDLAEFISGINGPKRGPDRETYVRMFWARQDLPHVAMRWASGVGAENLTIVTVPSLGNDASSVVERFGQAVGLDMGLLRRDGHRSNPSMGIAETEVIRRFNESFGASVSELVYHEVIREQVVRLALGAERKSPALRLPSDELGWVRERALSWVADIAAAGYPIVGDLQDLVPSAVAEDAPQPTDAEVLEAAIRALAGSVDAYAELRAHLDETPVRPSRLGSIKRRLGRGQAG